MSLSDTVFIFVLALIIFGPKKLPEIGRQIGRLVGEFRRASNEFKFQIDEELRLIERDDRTSSIAAAGSTETPTIAPPSAQDSVPTITAAAGTQARGALEAGEPIEASGSVNRGSVNPDSLDTDNLDTDNNLDTDILGPDNSNTATETAALQNSQSPVEVEIARG